MTEQIEQFARQYDGCHIVVTCRIAATDYTFDPAFIYLELADFAPDQVDSFVRNWFWDPAEVEKGADLAERMLAEWRRPEHAGIRDLGRNPLLLTLLCLNYAETLNLPSHHVEIYQEALDGLLKKWDSSRADSAGQPLSRHYVGPQAADVCPHRLLGPRAESDSLHPGQLESTPQGLPHASA